MPGATQCSGNGLETCQSSGTWSAAAACTNQTCLGGACTGVCAPGQTACLGNGLETCQSNGTWSSATTCTTGVTNAIGTCSTGMCTYACNGGYGACSGACVDEETDNANCGACAHSCGTGGSCVAGACVTCSNVALPPSVDVDATQWAANFKTSPIWNCNAAGTTTVDSNAGTITSTSCTLGPLDFTNNVTQSAAGGPTVMVVRLRGLTVSNNHLLKLQGNKPIIFLVSGNVALDSGGTIDASANATTAGPGGNGSACGTSAGTTSNATGTGGGGGGFGTPGGYGAKADGASGAAGGTAAASLALQPVRGGCPGGTGSKFHQRRGRGGRRVRDQRIGADQHRCDRGGLPECVGRLLARLDFERQQRR